MAYKEETEWVEKEVIENIIDSWQSMKCSACGKYYIKPYLYYISEPNYCPNCGAKTKRR